MSSLIQMDSSCSCRSSQQTDRAERTPSSSTIEKTDRVCRVCLEKSDQIHPNLRAFASDLNGLIKEENYQKISESIRAFQKESPQQFPKILLSKEEFEKLYLLLLKKGTLRDLLLLSFFEIEGGTYQFKEILAKHETLRNHKKSFSFKEIHALVDEFLLHPRNPANLLFMQVLSHVRQVESDNFREEYEALQKKLTTREKPLHLLIELLSIAHPLQREPFFQNISEEIVRYSANKASSKIDTLSYFFTLTNRVPTLAEELVLLRYPAQQVRLELWTSLSYKELFRSLTDPIEKQQMVLWPCGKTSADPKEETQKIKERLMLVLACELESLKRLDPNTFRGYLQFLKTLKTTICSLKLEKNDPLQQTWENVLATAATAFLEKNKNQPIVKGEFAEDFFSLFKDLTNSHQKYFYESMEFLFSSFTHAISLDCLDASDSLCWDSVIKQMVALQQLQEMIIPNCEELFKKTSQENTNHRLILLSVLPDQSLETFGEESLKKILEKKIQDGSKEAWATLAARFLRIFNKKENPQTFDLFKKWVYKFLQEGCRPPLKQQGFKALLDAGIDLFQATGIDFCMKISSKEIGKEKACYFEALFMSLLSENRQKIQPYLEWCTTKTPADFSFEERSRFLKVAHQWVVSLPQPSPEVTFLAISSALAVGAFCFAKTILQASPNPKELIAQLFKHMFKEQEQILEWIHVRLLIPAITGIYTPLFSEFFEEVANSRPSSNLTSFFEILALLREPLDLDVLLFKVLYPDEEKTYIPPLHYIQAFQKTFQTNQEPKIVRLAIIVDEQLKNLFERNLESSDIHQECASFVKACHKLHSKVLQSEAVKKLPPEEISTTKYPDGNVLITFWILQEFLQRAVQDRSKQLAKASIHLMVEIIPQEIEQYKPFAKQLENLQFSNNLDQYCAKWLQKPLLDYLQQDDEILLAWLQLKRVQEYFSKEKAFSPQEVDFIALAAKDLFGPNLDSRLKNSDPKALQIACRAQLILTQLNNKELKKQGDFLFNRILHSLDNYLKDIEETLNKEGGLVYTTNHLILLLKLIDDSISLKQKILPRIANFLKKHLTEPTGLASKNGRYCKDVLLAWLFLSGAQVKVSFPK